MSDAAETTARPHRTSMEGMIWNANHVLAQALRKGIRGIPREFFTSCAGVCIMSIVDVGFMFSGSVGTGIMMCRYGNGDWSNPVACGLTGVGFGWALGVAAKDVIFFLPDKNAVKTFFSAGVKVSGKTNATVGLGRDFQGGFGATKSGFTDVMAFGFSMGAFASLSLEGAVIAPRAAVNKHFYSANDEAITPADVIEFERVPFPADKVTLWPEVVAKLQQLAKGLKEGETEKEEEDGQEAADAEVTDDQDKVAQARVAADEAAEHFHKSAEAAEEEVVHVDAQVEAAKEEQSANSKIAAASSQATAAAASESAPPATT